MNRYRGEPMISLKQIATTLGINYRKEKERLINMINSKLKDSILEIPEFYIDVPKNRYYLSYLGMYLLFKDSNVNYHDADKLFEEYN